MAIVGIDIDGILADFQTGFAPVLVKTSGRDLFPYHPYSDPPCWDWPEYLGYSKEEVTGALNDVKSNPKFWEKLEAYPDVDEIMNRLWNMQKAGHEVYFITNRMGITPKHQTDRWLYARTPSILPSPTVLVSAQKGMSAAALELTHYIDDKPSNCTDVIKYRGLKTLTYLLDRPWNQEGAGSYVQRVKSVNEMLDVVEGKVPVNA